MCHRNIAVSSIFICESFNTIKLTVLLLTFQQVKHPFHKVINVEHFQLCASIIHSELLIICYSPAEGADRTIIFRSAMSHQIDKTINIHRGTCFFSVPEEQLLSCLLASTIFAVAKSSCQCGLHNFHAPWASKFLMSRSPFSPFLKAYRTKSTASSKDMMKRVMLGSVTMMGFPALIWSIHRGITDPRLHMTLP